MDRFTTLARIYGLAPLVRDLMTYLDTGDRERLDESGVEFPRDSDFLEKYQMYGGMNSHS